MSNDSPAAEPLSPAEHAELTHLMQKLVNGNNLFNGSGAAGHEWVELVDSFHLAAIETRLHSVLHVDCTLRFEEDTDSEHERYYLFVEARGESIELSELEDYDSCAFTAGQLTALSAVLGLDGELLESNRSNAPISDDAEMEARDHAENLLSVRIADLLAFAQARALEARIAEPFEHSTAPLKLAPQTSASELPLMLP